MRCAFPRSNNIARCFDRLKRPDEAAKYYAEVASVQKNNPYLQYARLSLAENAAAGGRKKEALESYSELANGSAPGGIRAEAAIKAAALAAEARRERTCPQTLQRRSQHSGERRLATDRIPGRSPAQLRTGQLQKSRRAGGEGPLGAARRGARAEILLLAGNSERQLGSPKAARAVYDRLLQQFPNAPSSAEARFHRLLSLYQLDDPKLVQEVDDFLR